MMHEYLSDAIVLNKQPNGDLDVRFSLFTKNFGKLTAKAKSARKITSKLAPHLEPGSVAQVRIIERGGLQLVDALKKGSLPLSPLQLHFLHQMLPEAEREPVLWHMLMEQEFSWQKILGVLGWDPREAECRSCAARPVAAFHIKNQDFFCERCAHSHPAKKELLYITSHE